MYRVFVCLCLFLRVPDQKIVGQMSECWQSRYGRIKVTFFYAYVSLSTFIKIPTSGWTVPAVVQTVADVSLTKVDNQRNCPEQRRK